jgi:hypothetical protein
VSMRSGFYVYSAEDGRLRPGRWQQHSNADALDLEAIDVGEEKPLQVFGFWVSCFSGDKR